MNLDVRWPIGLLFTLLGLLLAGYGLLSGPAAGGSLNRVWGGCLMLFGAALLTLAARARRR